MRLFHYLSPKLLPIFPADIGKTVFGVFVDHALSSRAEIRNFSGSLVIRISDFMNGAVVRTCEHQVAVVDGVPGKREIWYEAALPALGYTEVEIRADKPLFRRVVPEPGYALFSGVDGRCVTVNSDTKFAHYRVIEQIKTWQNFCLLHSACYVDPVRGCGNSMLIINPYDGPILVTLRGEDNRVLRVRIPSKSTQIIDLEPLLVPGKFGTVMVSGNNRVAAYDVRHPYGAWQGFNSVDHLDLFSGIATRHHGSVADHAKQALRRLARSMGIRYT